ncbi:hypothetical protein PROFUN_05169, partial [Planoprotostelium fungivorum]
MTEDNVSQPGDLQLCRRLLETKAASVTARDTSGNTPLHWAAYRNHLPLVRYYLSKILKRNLNQEQEENETSEEISTFSSAPASGLVDWQNYHDNQTPLHWAAIGGHIRVIHYLVKFGGASVNLTDRSGYNALHFAVQNNHIIVAQYALWRGCNINSKDREGHNALHWSAYQGHERMTQLLLNNSVAVDELDDSRYSPLHWACMKSHFSLVKLIVHHQPRLTPTLLSQRDKDNHTPEDIARGKEAYDIANYLRDIAGSPLLAMDSKTRKKIWFYFILVGGLVAFYSFAYISVPLTLVGIFCAYRAIPRFFPVVMSQHDVVPIVPSWFALIHFLSACVYLYKILSYILFTTLFLALHLAFAYCFHMLIRSDPGKIRGDGMNFKMLISTLEGDRAVPDICVTCN